MLRFNLLEAPVRPIQSDLSMGHILGLSGYETTQMHKTYAIIQALMCCTDLSVLRLHGAGHSRVHRKVCRHKLISEAITGVVPTFRHKFAVGMTALTMKIKQGMCARASALQTGPQL
jgi:hypothetical protein